MPLTVHEEALLELVAAGGDLPTDGPSRARLAALRRKGFLTFERTEDGDVWGIGTPKPARKRSRSRSRRK